MQYTFLLLDLVQGVTLNVQNKIEDLCKLGYFRWSDFVLFCFGTSSVTP